MWQRGVRSTTKGFALRDATASKQSKRVQTRTSEKRERKRKLKDEVTPYVKEGNHVNSKRLKINKYPVK
jgi:hypothetical protein